jgi:DNA-binding beta-propeller fold protein YncE
MRMLLCALSLCLLLAGGDLFEFGDRDGEGDEVRLQHPLGLALDAGRLYIADTYNHKLKVLDPRARTVKTFAGTGKPGQTDGPRPEFYEPGGLSVAGGKLYVADTNNHAVRVIDLKTKQTTTLRLQGLKPPAANAPVADTAGADEALPNAEQSKVSAQRLASAGDAALVVDVALPSGYHVNTDAPNRYAVTIEDGAQSLSLADAASSGKTVKDLRLPVRVPLRAAATGAARLRVSLRLYYCREDNTGTCRIKTLVWLVPVELTADPAAPREIRLQGKVEGE